ncbi:MAG: hypothetical protein N2449_07240 [Bacteroidales bacterium]|nr:hypothetical protein [Bacteroidales bacterium]
MRVKIILILTLILYIVENNYSQHTRYLIDSEKRLKFWFDTLFKRNEIRYILSDSLKKVYADSIYYELANVLQEENSFTYPFQSLEKLSKLTSSDSLVRVFTWNIKLSGNKFYYYGFILKRKNKTDRKSIVFPLNDFSDSLSDAELEQLTLSHNKWYGALYYQIMNYTYKKQTYYILIGWDGYSSYINRKVVEILYFNQRGKPLFGRSVFKSDTKTVKRLVFNHSIKASMTCHYDDNMKAIVFDHLVPSSSIYNGMYEFYGPNGTYDAYFLKNNLWIYKEDIEVKNPPPKK